MGQARVAIRRENRACGGGTVYYQAGTTCHSAMAVISRPPLPHAHANTRPRLMCHLCHCIHQTDNTLHSAHRCTWSHSIVHVPSHSPIKQPDPLCDATAIGPGSRRPAQPTTAAREAPQSCHVGSAFHPLVHPVSHVGSPSTRSITIVQSVAAPTCLWATPCRRTLGMTHKAG